MQKVFQCALTSLLLGFLLIGCSKKTAPGPSETAAPSPPAPTSPAAPTPPPVPPSYEGSWSGESGKDLPVSFTVQNNQVSSLSASYSGRNGSCSFNGSFSSDSSSSITGKTFTSHGKREQLEFNLTGTFTSANEASGTLVWKGNSGLCGDVNLQYNWTAKKAPPEQPDGN